MLLKVIFFIALKVVVVQSGQGFLHFELSAGYKRCLYERVSSHLLKKVSNESDLISKKNEEFANNSCISNSYAKY